MDEFIGIVKLFAGSFAPAGWAICDGSLLSVNQNTALFSILGTTYGGNGQTTFGLPDLRSRVPVGAGTGTGQSPIQAGEMGGTASVTLTSQQVGAHTHNTLISTTTATTNDPTSGILAQANYPDPSTGDPIAVNVYAAASNKQAPNISMNTSSGTPLSVMQPYLGMNYIICLNGVYPPRN